MVTIYGLDGMGIMVKEIVLLVNTATNDAGDIVSVVNEDWDYLYYRDPYGHIMMVDKINEGSMWRKNGSRDTEKFYSSYLRRFW